MKRPNIFIYISLGFLLKIFAYYKGQRFIKKIPVKGPAIILSNHTSFYDFIYTTTAIYPKRITYLAADKMMYDPSLGKYLRLARAIPKCLFQPDTVAILKAFKILDKKGIISVFPEGQISPTGKFLLPSMAIAKFLKKANCDVYIVKHHNAYFVNPPWTKKSFPGRIETLVEQIFTKETLTTLSKQDIYDQIVSKLSHNAHAYNAEKKYSYKLNDITNLESVIYQCPKCTFEGLTALKDRLKCPKCNHELVYDQYGLLSNSRIDELYQLQEDYLRHQMITNNDFKLTNHVKLMSYRHDQLVYVGEGTLTLSTTKYHFDGIIDGKNQILEFNPKNVPYLPSDIGKNIQIYDDYQIYQFMFDNKSLPTKYVIAGQLIHQLNTN